MDSMYVVAGFFVLSVVWLPMILRGSFLTLPIVASCFGMIIYWVKGWQPPLDEASKYLPLLTELVLVFAVMEAGLKIDRKLSFSGWTSTWRLILIVMPLSVAGVAALAVALLPVSLGVAVVIGAILAPTDPVLASSVGVGPPGIGEEGEVRFALTSEAGLNDGLAFPFVILGLSMIESPGFAASELGHWFLIEFLARSAAGVAIGAAIGLGLVFLNRKLPQRLRLPESGKGSP